MKVVAISDTHNQLKYIDVPDGDVLIHAGDFSMMGREGEVDQFFEDLMILPHQHKIFIAGNHDYLAQRNPEIFKKMIPEGITYLQDDEVIIDGVKLYGTPWIHNLPRWAFNIDDVNERAKKWSLIPDDVDDLISHGPPKRILDMVPRFGLGVENVGCDSLRYEVENRIKPAYHVFGHIHEEGSRWRKIGETIFINASNLDENYQIKNKPVIFNIEK